MDIDIKKKFTIAIIEFKHETNTFCSYKTTLDDFKARCFFIGNDILEALSNTQTEIAGYINVCKDNGHDVLPVIAADATPGGIVEQDTFDCIAKYILKTLSDNKGKYDAVLFAMHGAMVTENELDGDGALLSAVRQIVGASVPIFATLDLHANLSQKMLDNADALFPYETYPHTDQYSKAYETGARLIEHLNGQLSPHMVMRHIPILISVLETAKDPLKGITEKIDRLKLQYKDLTTASILQGFSWADTPDTGCSILVTTNGNANLAAETLDYIEEQILSCREDFAANSLISVTEAVDIVKDASDGPIVFADPADNPGSGGTADSTHILKALIDNHVTNAAFAIIVDPETVNTAISAGVGCTADVSLGGKAAEQYINGCPIRAKARVKTIADGIYVNKGKMANGVINNLGRTVVLDINGIEVIVTERRLQPWDLEVFRRMGIDPAEKKLLVVKSELHFRASFDTVAKKVFSIGCSGLASADFKSFKYKNIKRPILPLDLEIQH